MRMKKRQVGPRFTRPPRPQFFRQWREHLKLTQERVIERLEGWSQSKLSRIENGTTMWDGNDLADLEQAYGIPENLLLHVDPSKEGEVVDLVRIINEKSADKREQAIRILQAL